MSFTPIIFPSTVVYILTNWKAILFELTKGICLDEPSILCKKTEIRSLLDFAYIYENDTFCQVHILAELIPSNVQECWNAYKQIIQLLFGINLIWHCLLMKSMR